MILFYIVVERQTCSQQQSFGARNEKANLTAGIGIQLCTVPIYIVVVYPRGSGFNLIKMCESEVCLHTIWPAVVYVVRLSSILAGN